MGVLSFLKAGRTLSEAHAAALDSKVQKFSARASKLTPDELASALLKLPPGTAGVHEGFALVREAASRSLGHGHYPSQLVGGLALLEGHLAEMGTGEGKTLTVTLAAALLAREGKGVHVVTSNEYLAQRDADSMRPVYSALGLSVGAITSLQTLSEKKAAYQCDIVYGVGSEFGFDYLKDHLVRDASNKVQRELFAAIVDEVDSILIDEARVPLIISGTAPDNTPVFKVIDSCVRGLSPGEHYVLNLKEHTAEITDAGYRKVETTLLEGGFLNAAEDLYDLAHLFWVRQLHSAVKAYGLFKRDRDYVVANGEIVLVDQGTGRAMDGRRFDDGLHEALEAKEGVEIKQGTVVKATITYQNYFTKYVHLSGLSGTALTDAEEFEELYGLTTVVVPRNKPLQRKVLDDIVFRTKAEKFEHVVRLVQQLQAARQPVLVGCATIRDAEVLDSLFERNGIQHSTLTAKHASKEAAIIANAGQPGEVTIATNMAGRGTDILLGGERPDRAHYSSADSYEAALNRWRQNKLEVVKLGGLFVLGTERNGIRRVDNQLAGRSGRQGDPGTVQFLMSLEDDLLKVFGASKSLSAGQGAFIGSAPLSGPVVTRLVTSAQKSFEAQGFGARKNLMKYDAALAEQRQAVFDLRNSLLEGDASIYCRTLALEGFERWVEQFLPRDSFIESVDVAPLRKGLIDNFELQVPLYTWITRDRQTSAEVRDSLTRAAIERLDALQGMDDMQSFLRTVTFDLLDAQWEQHLSGLAELRENVSLKGFTGLNAVFQFHNDAFELFKSFKIELSHAYAQTLLRSTAVAARKQAEVARAQKRSGESKVLAALHERWVPRNAPCPCESGLRYRECHGALNPRTSA